MGRVEEILQVSWDGEEQQCGQEKERNDGKYEVSEGMGGEAFWWDDYLLYNMNTIHNHEHKQSHILVCMRLCTSKAAAGKMAAKAVR